LINDVGKLKKDEESETFPSFFEILLPIKSIHRMWFSQVVKSLFLAFLLSGALTQVGCYNFNFSPLTQTDPPQLKLENALSLSEAIQITEAVVGGEHENQSGRVFYNKQFRLWSKKKNITASFDTTFHLRINPPTSPVGEGMAFILAANATLPQNSDGEWLGIVNSITNGTSQANIVAVEFDTRKSYQEDLDDNHVGLDVNSINSIQQESLTNYGINLTATGYDAIKVRVQYDGKKMNVSASMIMKDMTIGVEDVEVLSRPLELSSHLPEVGFCGILSFNRQQPHSNKLRKIMGIQWFRYF
jgi:hypothetical protein